MIELLEDRVSREVVVPVREDSVPNLVALKQYGSDYRAKHADDRAVYSCDAVCKNCHCATYV